MSTATSASEASKESLESGQQQKQEEECKGTNEQSSNKGVNIDDGELEYVCPKVPPLKKGDPFYRECHRYPADFNCFFEERGEVPGYPVPGGGIGSGLSLRIGNEEYRFRIDFCSRFTENTFEQLGPRNYDVCYGGGKAWTLPIEIEGLSPIVLRALEPDARVLTLYDPSYGRLVTRREFKAFSKTPTAKALNATLDRAYPKRKRVSFGQTNTTHFK